MPDSITALTPQFSFMNAAYLVASSRVLNPYRATVLSILVKVTSYSMVFSELVVGLKEETSEGKYRHSASILEGVESVQLQLRQSA